MEVATIMHYITKIVILINISNLAPFKNILKNLFTFCCLSRPIILVIFPYAKKTTNLAPLFICCNLPFLRVNTPNKYVVVDLSAILLSQGVMYMVLGVHVKTACS